MLIGASQLTGTSSMSPPAPALALVPAFALAPVPARLVAPDPPRPAEGVEASRAPPEASPRVWSFGLELPSLSPSVSLQPIAAAARSGPSSNAKDLHGVRYAFSFMRSKIDLEVATHHGPREGQVYHAAQI